MNNFPLDSEGKILKQIGCVVLGAGLNKEFWTKYSEDDGKNVVVDHDSYLGIYKK